MPRFSSLNRFGRSGVACALLSLLLPTPGRSDGFAVDRIYQPYVQPYEREFELRALYLRDSDPAIDGAQVDRFGYGQALTDRWFAELYIIAADDPGETFAIEGYELELKWQLTEQGEYAADWGLLFELEKERNADIWEYSTTLLMEKEFGRWSATANVAVLREWGSDISNEWESEFAGQFRYRYTQEFEPNFALYLSEDTKGVGPGAQGRVKFSRGRGLHWQVGLIFGIDGASPDQSLRGLLEYEF